MEFGTSIPQHLLFEETSAGRQDSARRLVQALEDAGFSYVTAGDHIIHPGVSHHDHEDPEKVIYGDVFALLAYYASLSRRLKLVTGVLILPYRQPFSAAHALATVDQLSGGRAVLGIGPGYAKVEFEAFGIDLRERGPITDEYLDIITLLLSQRDVTFEGRYYQFHNVSLLFPPVQKPRPPIWVGGSGKRALERAVLRGDVWVPIATGVPVAGKRRIRVAVTPRELREDLAEAHERRREIGKPPLGARLSASTALLFMRGAPAQPRPADPWDRYLSGCGSAAELAEQLCVFKEAGAEGVSLGLVSRTVDECLRDIEVVAKQVIEPVRAK